MKKQDLFFIVVLLACNAMALHADQQVVTYISPRSQSFNAARGIVGWEQYINIYHNETCNYALAITPEITKSFRPERVTQCLFGDDILDCNNTITISGSRNSERTRNQDWLADYFGLPPDFKSRVNFRPRVNTFLIDFDYYMGFDNWVQGLYFRIHAPLVYSKWNLNAEECVDKKGTQGYDAGYFNPEAVDRAQLLTTALAFFRGKTPNIENLTFNKLSFAQFSCGNSITRIADIRTTLGYNAYQKKRYQVGFNLQAAFPTGNRPEGKFLFEPMIGNGYHWELGAGLHSHLRAWRNPETKEKVDLYFELNALHQFTTEQTRTFDLAGKANSRYILAHKVTSPVEHNLQGIVDNVVTSANTQFKQEVTPVANLTTFCVDVSANIQFEFLTMLSYSNQRFTFSWGYSFWKRSCENICITNRTSLPENTWALKGDAYVFGFIGEQPNINDLAIGTPIALSATESKATINSGANFPKSGIPEMDQAVIITQSRRNPNIDNRQRALAGNNQRLVASTDDLTAANQINTSIQPTYISFMDIDSNSARTRGVTHKVFAHLNKHWKHTSGYSGFLGFGAEVDFGRQAGKTPEIERGKCINCALSYWGVWLKGGFSFR